MNPIEIIFGAIERGLGAILAGFYAVIPSYGLAIILLTLLIRFALYPITARAARSMRKMQLLQPHMKKLQEKHKDDRQKQSEEQMKLFKANKVSPISGCLPLLIQMPFLLAMFRVLVGDRSQAPGEASTAFIPEGSQLFKALSGATIENPGPLDFLGLNLGLSPRQAFENFDLVGLWGFVAQVVVIALIVATGVYQQRQIQKRRSDDEKESKAASEQQGPQQAMQTVGKVMPIAFGVISIFWPAGLNIYWLTSNAFQVGQQALVLRKDKDWEPVLPEPEKKSKGQKGPKPTKDAGTRKRVQAGDAKGKDAKSKPGAKSGGGSGPKKGGGPKKAVPKRVQPKSKGAQARAAKNGGKSGGAKAGESKSSGKKKR